MELYYSPGACSIGIHVLLDEIGKPYQLKKLNFANREQYAPEFTGINPKSKVPTLVRDDGSVLTEFPAIATYLARTNPQAHLLPEDVEGQVRTLEALDYAVSTIHMQGFSRLFRPANFSSNEAEHDAVKARGREIADKGFALMNKTLDGKDYVGGAYSIADAALFYVEFWAQDRLKQQLPPNCAAHLARMKARPAVQSTLKAEGLT
jgi:glutathione S-transferase